MARASAAVHRKPMASLLRHSLVGLLLVVTAPAVHSRCRITQDVFGSYGVPERGGQRAPVHRYTLSNGRMAAQVIEYGATLTSIKLPDRTGRMDDVLLGFDNLAGFLGADNPYFGATVGRVANRIAGGQFTLDNITYKLFQNNGNNSLHGGLRGFDKKLWNSQMEPHAGRVVMMYTSPDGEEGYPGQVDVVVTYTLTPDNMLVIEYNASSTKRTPINLTNHAYFNLAGHAAGSEALYRHSVAIAADHVTETGSDQIPTGRLTPVEGTTWDLRKPKKLGDAIKATPNSGFDDNFVLAKQQPGGVIAMAWDPVSGRKLEVYTSQPGLQFYTSNSLAPVLGKGQARYTKHAAFCMEAQNFPDAVNHPKEFPNSVIGPNEVYHQVIGFKFEEPARKCNIQH